MDREYFQNSVHAILIVIISTLFIGCNEVFEPWQENDRYHFSIYGYLDASADTQWVRVMPVREDLLYQPGPIDAVVTLENLESGETVVMNDSLFEYEHSVYAYNFWTSESLNPGDSYRIRVLRSDDAISSAVTTLPNDFPTPIIRNLEREDQIIIEGAERLVDFRIIHYLQFHNTDDEYMIPFSHLQDTLRMVSGGYMIINDPRDDMNRLSQYFGMTPRTITHQQIFIVSGGPGFHFFPGIDEKIVALPEGISNVTNGTGYLAGVVSKTIPYQSCLQLGTSNPAPCQLDPYPWSQNVQIWEPSN
ncbi:MAG: hypothetical protein WD355_08915 [Balneolaceae bacterium]